MLPLSHVTNLRRQATRLMPESWSISRPVYAPDGQGGRRVTGYTTPASGSAAANTGARLMPAGTQAAERILAERPAAIGAWTITLPQGTDVRPDDRIIIRSRSFEVTGIGGSHTWDVAVQVAAAEVTG